MPQMAPLMWLILFFSFITIFLFFNILNYFNFLISKMKTLKTNSNSMPYFSVTWKW